MKRKYLALLPLLALMLALPLQSWADHAEAEKAYRARCQSCHAADGSADTPAGKKTGTRDFALPEVWKMSDAEWIEVTAKGKGKMPGYAKMLNEKQTQNLVTYIRALVKPRAEK